MVNWRDPKVEQRCYEIFLSISHVAIGCYLWEALSRISFEWSLITGKRAWRWPMALYLFCKWILVSAFVGMLIALNTRSKMNCQALYTFNQFGGNAAMGATTTLLMLRSVAIWKVNRFIAVPFLIIGLGLWGILFHGVTTVRADWSDVAGACVVREVSSVYLTLCYMYTMFTDFIVLVVTLAGLSWSPGQSGLWRMLWEQGIMFFVVAFAANLVPAVVIFLNLNTAMGVMFGIPAIAASATCACRCYVSLLEYDRKGDGCSAVVATNPSGWTHRIQGPITEHGRPVTNNSAMVQFSRQVPKDIGPIDTFDGLIRTIPGQDIHLSDYSSSPIKYNHSSDDALSLPQLRRVSTIKTDDNDPQYKGDQAV